MKIKLVINGIVKKEINFDNTCDDKEDSTYVFDLGLNTYKELSDIEKVFYRNKIHIEITELKK